MPTRMRLKYKHVECPNNCGICGEGEENYNHVFLQCPKSIECWEKVGLFPMLQQLLNNGVAFATLIFSFL